MFRYYTKNRYNAAMSTAFTPILQGTAPVHKLLEDERYLSFLEAIPLAEGHALVIPKKETDDLFALEDEELAGLVLFAKRVAAGIRKTVPCVKIAVQVYGIKVRHAHVHLVPVQGVSGELDLANAKKADDAALARTAEKIRAALA